jgi:hypothetical protein
MNMSLLEPAAIFKTTTKPNTLTFSSKPIPRTVTAHQRLLFTHKPWIYSNFSGSRLFTATSKPTIKSTTYSPTLSSIIKTTLQSPTPWYSPAGPFDWWQWQWYTTPSQKSPITIHSPQQTTRTISRTSTTSPTVATTTTTALLTNKTGTIPTSAKFQATADWFKWPDKTFGSTKKESSDDSGEEYRDWLEYFTGDKIQEIRTSATTTTTTTSTSTPIPLQQQQQQMGYPPMNSNWKIVTINTPPAKRQHSQQSPVVSERNALAMAANGKNEFI